MLVLSRKSTERIHVGDDVVVAVVEIRGNKVRVGIDAPREIHVVRGEWLISTMALGESLPGVEKA